MIISFWIVYKWCIMFLGAFSACSFSLVSPMSIWNWRRAWKFPCKLASSGLWYFVHRKRQSWKLTSHDFPLSVPAGQWELLASSYDRIAMQFIVCLSTQMPIVTWIIYSPCSYFCRNPHQNTSNRGKMCHPGIWSTQVMGSALAINTWTVDVLYHSHKSVERERAGQVSRHSA